MNRWVWIGGGLLLAVIAAGLWFATQNPQWVAGLIAGLGAALWKALAPAILKALQPASPEELKRLDEGPGRSGDTKPAKGSARPFGREKGW